MELLLGKRKIPEQMLRENQRVLNKAIRDLDRERTRLENQEKKVISDIKMIADRGQMDAVKIITKDLVLTRNYIKKFILMRANIQAVSLKMQTYPSTNAMAQAIKGVARTIAKMNARMNLPEMQKIMMAAASGDPAAPDSTDDTDALDTLEARLNFLRRQ